MADSQTRWIARLTPTTGHRIDEVLRIPLALDVWERGDNALVVVASETQLSELERRRLVHVDRLRTVLEYPADARSYSDR
jgi:hypothetical protein